MKYLIVSHLHHLLPFAWRLLREGHEVDVVVVNRRYQTAWDGRIPKAIQGPVPNSALEPWKEAAATGELVVLTDSTKALEVFAGAPRLFAPWSIPAGNRPVSNLFMGAWFDGTDWHDPHWFIPDRGLWPGGFGPRTLGGGLVARPQVFRGPAHHFDVLTESFSAEGRRGLVQIGMQWDSALQAFKACEVAGGLPWLHSHAYLSGLTNFGQVLAGEAPVAHALTYTVALPVSQPPWPVPGAPAPDPQELPVAPELTQRCFFHDIKITNNKLSTAGLDGLIAVVHSSANLLELARHQTLQVAVNAFAIPERQIRVDVGALAQQGLMELETRGLF